LGRRDNGGDREEQIGPPDKTQPKQKTVVGRCGVGRVTKEQREERARNTPPKVSTQQEKGSENTFGTKEEISV